MSGETGGKKTKASVFITKRVKRKEINKTPESRDRGAQLCNLPSHQCWSLAGLSDRDAYNLPEVYTYITCT